MKVWTQYSVHKREIFIGCSHRCQTSCWAASNQLAVTMLLHTQFSILQQLIEYSIYCVVYYIHLCNYVSKLVIKYMSVCLCCKFLWPFIFNRFLKFQNAVLWLCLLKICHPDCVKFPPIAGNISHVHQCISAPHSYQHATVHVTHACEPPHTWSAVVGTLHSSEAPVC